MTDIKLNLFNHSEDTNNTTYVIFQNNVSLDAKVQSVAWKVIHDLGNGCRHPFVYPTEYYVGATDANGNHMPAIPAETGATYEVFMTNSGHELRCFNKPAANPIEVEIWNNLKKGSINAQIYRGGSLIATKQNVTPGSKANFQFQPKLYIGAVSHITEGAILNSNITVQYLTELNLQSVSAANIIITGGGVGTDSTPIKFTLIPLI
jgi:hypothetical protein